MKQLKLVAILQKKQQFSIEGDFNPTTSLARTYFRNEV